MVSLDRFLADYDMAMLRALAQRRGIALSSNRQAEAAEELAASLIDPVSVRTALARLSAEARNALASVLGAGGQMRASQFARRHGQLRPIGPGRLEREAPWHDPANAAEELWYSGLIFRGFSQADGGTGEFIYVPEELVRLLPDAEPERPAFLVDTVAAPLRQAAQASPPADDLFAYLVYIQNHDVRLYADGRLSQRDLMALGKRWHEGDKRRFTFLQHLAARMGIVVRQGESLRLEAGAAKRWLSATATQQLAMMQQAWHDDPTWNDLCHVPTLVCDREMPWQNDPVATRRALLALLARCPVDSWWSVPSFVAAVKESDPDFQRPDGDYASWYIRDATSGEYHSGFQSWGKVEGALIADLLEGTLSWLGFVDYVAVEDGAVCRLTAAGARFPGLADERPPETPQPPLTLHSDLGIDVPPPSSLYTLFQLERFSNRVSASPSPQVPGSKLHRYRITAASLGRALARGIRVEQVIAFLQQASGRPVPAPAAEQLYLWAGRFGQVQLDEVALLQVKSEQILKELSALPETRALIGRILSPTSALVRKENLPRLRRELASLGYLSPVDAPDDSAGPG
jgi:hypothetical protein